MRDGVRRVLITTKYRFIGDTLNAVPTLRAVKQRWPDAEVTLLSGARACELLQNCPYVDRFIEFDPYRAADKGIKQYVKLLMLLRRRSFDVCLVLNRSFHSALTAALGGAKRRVGWARFEGRDFLLTDLCGYDQQKSEAECFLDLFRSVGGVYDDPAALQIWLTNDELAKAAEQLPKPGFLVGIQPGATHGYKQWPLSRFVELCETLVQQNDNVKTVLIGGPDEQSIAQDFLALASPKLSSKTTSLVGKMSLRSTLAAVSQLNAFVGNDTAIRHAAIAANVQSIGLFGPTSWTKWGNALPPRHIVLVASTGKMEDLSVDNVLNATSRWQDDQPEPISVGGWHFGQVHENYSGVEPGQDRVFSEVPFLLERGANE